MKKLALLLAVALVMLGGIQTASAQTAASQQSETAPRFTWKSVKPETIQGTISMIVADQKVVVVTAEGGVPYDITITGKTKIEIGGTRSTFDDLAAQVQKQATVTFVARRHGDVAQSITVSD